MVAKFNSIDNEVNDLLITKQPTIRFHTIGNKAGIDFAGNAKNIKELQAFMAEHSAAFRTHYDKVHASAANTETKQSEDL